MCAYTIRLMDLNHSLFPYGWVRSGNMLVACAPSWGPYQYHRLNCVLLPPPLLPNSCVKAVDPTVFGDKAFGRWFGLDEVMRVGPHDGIKDLIRKDTSELALSLSMPDMKDTWKLAVPVPERIFPRNQHAGTLHWTSGLQNREIILLFKPPSL